MIGSSREYLFGSPGSTDEVPRGWEKSPRPCRGDGCHASVTYVDKDKIWHCLICGWGSDMKRYSDEDIKVAKDMYESGMSNGEIAVALDRDDRSVASKVFSLRKNGEIAKVRPEKNVPAGEEGKKLKKMDMTAGKKIEMALSDERISTSAEVADKLRALGIPDLRTEEKERVIKPRSFSKCISLVESIGGLVLSARREKGYIVVELRMEESK